MSAEVMTDDVFWNYIQQSQPFGDGQVERLSALLNSAECSAQQAFSTSFLQHAEDAYRWDIWGAAYLYGGGCSDDSFMDFRAGLIAQGQRVFDNVLNEPDQLVAVVESLPEGTDLFFEKFGYVHSWPFSEGDCTPPLTLIQPNAHALSAHREGNDWDFDDDAAMQLRYPNLWQLVQEAK